MSGDRCDLCEVFAPVYCPGCLQKAEEDTRTATVREIAKRLNFDKGFELQQALWEDLENAVNESNFSTTQEDIESALWSLLGGKPDGVNPCPDCGAHPGTVHLLGCKFDGVR